MSHYPLVMIRNVLLYTDFADLVVNTYWLNPATFVYLCLILIQCDKFFDSILRENWITTPFHTYVLITPGICSACYLLWWDEGLASVASAICYKSICVQPDCYSLRDMGLMSPLVPDLQVFTLNLSCCHVR